MGNEETIDEQLENALKKNYLAALHVINEALTRNGLSYDIKYDAIDLYIQLIQLPMLLDAGGVPPSEPGSVN